MLDVSPSMTPQKDQGDVSSSNSSDKGKSHVSSGQLSKASRKDKDELAKARERSCRKLHTAINRGRIASLRRVLSKPNLDINCRRYKQRTALMIAVMSGRINIVKMLVEHGSTIHLVDADLHNPLHFCSLNYHEKIQVMKYLVSRVPGLINDKSRTGMTPVMYAASHGHWSTFMFLVAKNCSLTIRSRDARNILHHACSGGSVDIIRYIIEHKLAYKDSTDGGGKTGLMLTAEHGRHDPFQYLVGRNCSLTLLDKRHDNMLHFAATGGNIQIVRYILGKNVVNVKARNRAGKTPLMNAAHSGKLTAFKELTNKGATLSTQDNYKYTILHSACMGGLHLSMVKHILSLGIIDTGSRGKDGKTALMVAAGNRNSRPSLLKLLIKSDADLLIKTKQGDTILHVVCATGSVQNVKFLLSKNVFDLESRGNYGRTPLMVATKSDRKDVFEVLLNKGSTTRGRDSVGNNILHLSCNVRRTEILRRLIKLVDADLINQKNKKGLTALQTAKRFRRKDIVKVLHLMNRNKVSP